MTVGYVIEFPGELTAEAAHRIREAWHAATSSKAREAVVLAAGGHVVELNNRHPKAAFISRARARVR